jgi:hypothetical protein
MTDLKARLADALHDNGCHPDDAIELAEALLTTPGITIVDTSGESIPLVDGRQVPAAAVAALAELERVWPGATPLPQARPAIVAAVLTALRSTSE